MFNCELMFDGENLRIHTEERYRDVRELGVCVMRASVNFVQIQAEEKYVDAANRFSAFYCDVADKFLSFCVENIGKRASEEFMLADARARYRFMRYECRCELIPRLVQEGEISRLEVSRHTCLRRRNDTIWEDGDILVWKLPSLLIGR